MLNNGVGQYDYEGKNSYLIFGFLEGKTDSILFSSKNKNDAMPIIGSVKFSDNYKTISQKVPKGYTLREQYKEGKETTYCLEGTGARVQLTWNDTYGRSNYSTDALTTVYID